MQNERWFDRINDALKSKDQNKKRKTITLRKSVGRKVSDVNTETLSAFYSFIHCPESLEEKAFYLTCLLCEQGENGTTGFPKAWNEFAKKKDLPTTTVARLVDSPWSDQVAMQLIRIARRLINAGYLIDFEDFKNDVIFWGSDITKRKWARLLAEEV